MTARANAVVTVNGIQIEVHAEGDTVLQCVSQINDVIQHNPASPAQKAPAPTPTQAPAPAQESSSAPAPSPAPAAAPPAPSAAATAPPTAATGSATETAAPSNPAPATANVTAEQLHDAAVALLDKGYEDKLGQILQQLGAATVGTIPADKRGEALALIQQA